MQAIEFAVDPNGDGNTDDHVDVLNMSIGSNYGDPRWDDTSLAVNNAAAIGVLSVVSAGNSGDKPYSTGTPSAASAALAEYLDTHGLSRVSKRLATSGIIDVVATASPGIDDIVVLGKIKQLDRSGTFDDNDAEKVKSCFTLSVPAP